jgi:hypothetical protein
MADLPHAATAARNQHTTETILLALIAVFSEVSGEAAYEVSMMHLGATGRKGISTVLLLHTHTAQYCFVLTVYSNTITLYCPSPTNGGCSSHPPRSYEGPACRRQALSSCTLAAPHLSDFTYIPQCHMAGATNTKRTSHRFHITSPTKASDNG